jgi:hypothetical protein
MTRRALPALLALALLVGCRADEELLASFIPAGLTITETLSSEAKTANCQRATFLAEATPGALDDFTRLGSLYPSSFLDCVPRDERNAWLDAIGRGSAVWSVGPGAGDEVHIWYDTQTGRLQVMQLAR